MGSTIKADSSHHEYPEGVISRSTVEKAGWSKALGGMKQFATKTLICWAFLAEAECLLSWEWRGCTAWL